MFCITEQGSAILHKAYYRRTSITFVGTDVLAFTFWKAPERVQIMKKVNRNNRAIDVTTVGGRIK